MRLAWRERANQFLEDASAVLVIFKLVKAGTGGRQENGIARPREFKGGGDGAVEGFGLRQRNGAG